MFTSRILNEQTMRLAQELENGPITTSRFLPTQHRCHSQPADVDRYRCSSKFCCSVHNLHEWRERIHIESRPSNSITDLSANQVDLKAAGPLFPPHLDVRPQRPHFAAPGDSLRPCDLSHNSRA